VANKRENNISKKIIGLEMLILGLRACKNARKYNKASLR